MPSTHKELQDCICPSSVICHSQVKEIIASKTKVAVVYLQPFTQYLHFSLVPKAYDLQLILSKYSLMILHCSDQVKSDLICVQGILLFHLQFVTFLRAVAWRLLGKERPL